LLLLKAKVQIDIVTNKSELATFLGKKLALNAYPLGDLDDRYWPDTKWFALKDGKDILEIALLYSGLEPSILLAITNNNTELMQNLISGIQDKLPNKVYAHLNDSLLKTFGERYQTENHGPHYIMELRENGPIREYATSGVLRLSSDDFDDMHRLYEKAYPGHWFSEKMLAHGSYFGIRNSSGKLVSISGLHVYSEEYSVATLGNIVTHPNERGKGLGSMATARLCQELMLKVTTIGLNVRSENSSALHIYQSLGFKTIAEYEEITLTKS
jgi:GNAT superfamily N-acetyltransferase